MKKNTLHIAILALSFLAIGCAKTGNADEPKYVTVQLTVSATDVLADTRSDMPLFPEQENWIWDFYYVQYDNEGRTGGSGHIRSDATNGELSITAPVVIREANETTILVVANIEPAGAHYSDNPGWRIGSAIFIGGGQGYLSNAKLTKFDMTKRLTRDSEGHYSTLNHMPMCGYWEGKVTAGSNNYPINIALGRMVTRMNVNITNNSNYDVDTVTLNNVAMGAYVYPQYSNAPLASGDYLSAPVTQNVPIPRGTTKTLYFYSAPNYCDENHITSIQFHSGSRVSAPKELGSYIVDESDRSKNDYNLYMNTIYTFNLTLN